MVAVPVAETSVGSSPAAASGRKDLLVRAIADANRITIAPARGGQGATTVPAPQDLRGQYLVAEFLDTLTFDETHGAIRIESPIDATFTLRRDDTVIGTLTIRRLNYVRWEGGTWEGDALLTPAAAQALVLWTRQSGADITGVVQALALSLTERQTEGRRRMLSNFTGAALDEFGEADSVIFRSRRLRWVATDLPDAFPTRGALAESALRALDTRGLGLLQDDWGTGALQTALLEMEPDVVLAAMEGLYSRDAARLGIARVYFRGKLWERLSESERDGWTERLADAALRAAPDSDKTVILEFLSEIPGPAAANFLRSVATGERSYAYAPTHDDLGPVIEEPSLRPAAALLLAGRGEPDLAPVLAGIEATNPFGPDRAAVELARTLLASDRRPTIAHLRYRSRLLGMASLRALERLPASAITVDLAVAASENVEGDVLTAVDALLRTLGLKAGEEGPVPTRPDDTVDPLMATTHPERAIAETTTRIATAQGRKLAELYAIRAEAQSSLRRYAEAEVDFLNAEQTPWAKDLGVRRRLVWTQWYLGDFEAAEDTIGRALVEEPSSEFLLLRGLLHYSQADFGIATEADFLTAMILDPTDGYAALFHHLAASLGGREDRSLLSGQIAAPLYGPEWPRHIMAFMLGLIDANRLLELAAGGDPSEVGWHSAEANFYIAQAARIAGRRQEERRYLEACIALDQPHVAEFWLARYRLEELDGDRSPAPQPQPAPTPQPQPQPRRPNPVIPQPQSPATRPPPI